MATNFWLHTFGDVSIEDMAGRLFPDGTPEPYEIHRHGKTFVVAGMLVRVASPEVDYVEATTPEGQWSREEMQSLVSMRVDNDGDFGEQFRLAEQLAERVMSSGLEDISLAQEEHLVLRRVNGVVERFALP